MVAVVPSTIGWILFGLLIAAKIVFLHIVGYARQLGFAVKIFTNGITMTSPFDSVTGLHLVDLPDIAAFDVAAELVLQVIEMLDGN